MKRSEWKVLSSFQAVSNTDKGFCPGVQGPHGFILWSGPERGFEGPCGIWILFGRRMACSRAVHDSWGNAKWKEGQAAPASAEETTQLLKGQCEGLEWNELSRRIYHSDSEIRV